MSEILRYGPVAYTYVGALNVQQSNPSDLVVMNHTKIVQNEWALLDIKVQDGNTNSVVLTGRTLTIADLISVARHNVRATLDPATVQRMKKSVTSMEKNLEEEAIIYGVNTGFGGSADLRTTQLVQLQRALIRELHYGILPPGRRDHHIPQMDEGLEKHRHDLTVDAGIELSCLPSSWARAAILIRINSLISGCSAVRPVIVERMQDLLNHAIVPMIPLRGSISASGDLSPLSYITGAIQGKCTIRVFSRDTEHMYADTAFAEAGLEPVYIQAKEGLAMTNGTAVSAAVGALALHDTHALAVIAQVLTAMSVEALNGSVESFHPFFSQTRPHPGQAEAAQNILAFLGGSRLTKVNDGSESALRQDRYAVRTAPQWLGPILEDLVLAHQQISIECNSATDNPLLTPEGESLHGGNFQAKAVTAAMEKARQGIQGIGRMLFSQCTEMINPATNRGLPPNLVVEDPSITLIFKGTDLNIAALAAELGFLAHPVNHVQTAEMGNQSLNSLALISARYTHTANEVLSQLMAAHLIAACQALDLRAMHMQFLAVCEPQFREFVAAHFSRPMAEGQSGISNAPPNDALPDVLWAQLLTLFDATASMDSKTRFVEIARSLRTVFLDHPDLTAAPGFIPRLDCFAASLATLLQDAWCSNRDAYLAHGDASVFLGKASAVMYTFVRRTLRVPLLATGNLATPGPGELEDGRGAAHGTQAPTVGSFLGAVHRALRDGTLAKVAVELLGSSAD